MRFYYLFVIGTSLFISFQSLEAQDSEQIKSIDGGIILRKGPLVKKVFSPPLGLAEENLSPGPCEGDNYEEDDSFLDSDKMTGPMISVAWIPTSSVTINRIEIFTGESTGPIALAIWSDDGGKPLSNLGNTSYFKINPTNSWQGEQLLTPVMVTAGTPYWLVIDPTGGEQASITDGGSPQVRWGSFQGDIMGGAAWQGPFSSPDIFWKFKMFCASGECLGLPCTIMGTSQSDSITGTSGDDVICGEAGNDIIDAKEGNDMVCGGEGDDVLIGGDGHDRLDGGAGNDLLNGGKGRDLLDGGSGNDVLLGKQRIDMLFGGTGNDYLDGGGGNDFLNGGAHQDVCENRGTVIDCESMLSSYGESVTTASQNVVKVE